MDMSEASRRGRAANRKGSRAELEIRDILRKYGYTDARRNFASGGQGGSDLVEAIPDVAIEVKRAETPQWASWWRQANRAAKPTDLTLLVHRGNHQPWQATALLTDLHMLMQHLPMAPVIAASNPRGVFLAEHRLSLPTRRPFVLHRISGDVVATVLFTDWLDVWVGPSTSVVESQEHADDPHAFCALPKDYPGVPKSNAGSSVRDRRRAA